MTTSGTSTTTSVRNAVDLHHDLGNKHHAIANDPQSLQTSDRGGRLIAEAHNYELVMIPSCKFFGKLLPNGLSLLYHLVSLSVVA